MFWYLLLRICLKILNRLISEYYRAFSHLNLLLFQYTQLPSLHFIPAHKYTDWIYPFSFTYGNRVSFHVSPLFNFEQKPQLLLLLFQSTHLFEFIFQSTLDSNHFIEYIHSSVVEQNHSFINQVKVSDLWSLQNTTNSSCLFFCFLS